MGVLKPNFVLTIVIAVFVLLLTRCLSTGIALNRSYSEQSLATTSTEPTAQLKNTPRKTQFKSPPTISSLYPTRYINKTWNCSEINLRSQKEPGSNTSVHVYYTDYDAMYTSIKSSRLPAQIQEKSKDQPYVCHLNPLHCTRPKQLETNEKKKVLTGLPKYGDYSYLPISQWILLLQHGAVVFLYHPCSSQENIDKLRNIARKCMWKHIITPYEHLNITQLLACARKFPGTVEGLDTMLEPIAMVAWASFYADWKVNETASETWIKNNAMKGPASHVILDGRYNFNLRHPAKIVSDPLDSHLCPKTQVKKTKEEDLDILNEHYNSLVNQGRSSKTLKKHLLQKIKHGLRPEKRTMDTGNAAWAVGSLLFLCLVLVFVLVYTKPWNERDYYLREKMASRSNSTNFSLLKSHFNRGGRTWREVAEQQRHAAASRRLLGPIHEEDEDFMDL